MYRFGFNGQEIDKEVNGTRNTYTATFWEYDARLGRRWNIDPKFKSYPHKSPYLTFSNSPIIRKDPGGDDDYYFNRGGVLVDRVINQNPDCFYITSQTKITNRTLNDNKTPTPKIDFQITPNSNLGTLARAIYGEMGGGNEVDKQIVGESILNRMTIKDGIAKGNSVSDIVEKKTYSKKADRVYYQYDIANPNSERNDEYIDPESSYKGNPIETNAFIESMSVSIKLMYSKVRIGNGVTSYNSSNAKMYDNKSTYIKLVLPKNAQGVKGMWMFKVDKKKEIEVSKTPISK